MNLGSVVQLASGGPTMTVDSLDNSGVQITCLWFCEDDLQVATFPQQALRLMCERCLKFIDDAEIKEGIEWCDECYNDYNDWCVDMIIDQMIDRSRGK